MNANSKTKEELIKELTYAKQRITELEFMIKRQKGILNEEGKIKDVLASVDRDVKLVNAFSEITAVAFYSSWIMEALRNSEEQFYKAFQANPNPMAINTLEEGRFIDVNKSFLELLGYRRDELINQTVAELSVLQPEVVARMGAIIASNGKISNMEVEFRKKTGDTGVALISLEVINLKGLSCILSAGNDITERIQLEKQLKEYNTRLEELVKVRTAGLEKTVEKLLQEIAERKSVEVALRGSEERLRLITDNMMDLIGLTDANLIIRYINPAVEQTLGYKAEELIGKNAIDLHHPDEVQVINIAIEGAIKLNNVRSVKYRLKHRNGHYLWFEGIIRPILNESGSILGFVVANRDITGRISAEEKLRAVEEQLYQAQKMDALGQLAGGIAHDFNNLLTGIISNISFVLTKLPHHGILAESLEDAERAARRAAEITAKLLGFSRKTVLKPTDVNVNDVVTETVAILKRTIDPRITINTALEPKLSMVMADHAQITQLLMNLCLNARDAIGDKGDILLETQNVNRESNLQMEGKTGNYVLISISDTGCGIQPENLKKLYEPFFTTKGEGRGTGLGLPMVYGIVKQHGGWVDCISSLGKGTKFMIYLPCNEEEIKTASKHQPKVNAFAVKGTLLVVDDEDILRNSLKRFLSKFGYNVFTAKDGETAIKVYQEECSKIDLVLLDLTMPGITGLETLKSLKRINPRVSVLLSSGYSKNNISEKGLKEAVGFLEKPYHITKLLQTINQHLK